MNQPSLIPGINCSLCGRVYESDGDGKFKEVFFDSATGKVVCRKCKPKYYTDMNKELGGLQFTEMPVTLNFAQYHFLDKLV